MMRITIEVDDRTGVATATPGGSVSSGAGAGAGAAMEQSVPPEVLALAAADGALNGGPAPTMAASAVAGAPHPYHGRGAGMTDAEHAAAQSGGGAPKQ